MTTLNALGLLSFLFVAGFTWRAYTREPGPGQSPRSAIAEAWLNVVVGFSANFCINVFMIPLMSPGGHMTAIGNFWGGWVYTALSIVRSYGLRRGVNWWHHVRAQRAGRAA